MSKRQALADNLSKCVAELQAHVDEPHFFDRWVDTVYSYSGEYIESLIPATPQEQRMAIDTLERNTDGKHL